MDGDAQLLAAEQIYFANCEGIKSDPRPMLRKVLALGDGEYEVRADGQRVRKDRWETGFRSIVSILVGPRTEFEIDEIVEMVRGLLPPTTEDAE